MSESVLRQLPAVSLILNHDSVQAANARYGRGAIIDAVRAELDAIREQCRRNPDPQEIPDLAQIASAVLRRLAETHAPHLRRVLNATGIVLHTNLGRSPIAEEAATAAYEAARGYLNLELDLDSGKRSSRQHPIRTGITALTGAESATAVNNCAAATVIVLRTLAAGKEVIVSRGQLIEIGGSFRIPDIMTVSGAVLREVGTTNITRIADYEQAIGLNTGAIMRIHTSNYRIRGFTKAATLAELVELGNKHHLPVIDDVGSGATVDLSPFGLPGEPIARESIAAGADLVLFSGDKLLGGPQAGIIAGKSSFIERIERDPMMRAFRLDKMTLAALEATLRLHRDPENARRLIPTLRMLTTPAEELKTRCERLAERLRILPGFVVTVRADEAFVGGGSLPDIALPTFVIAIRSAESSEAEFAARLRTGTPVVMARIQDGEVLLDLRTIFAEDEEALVQAIANAAGHTARPDSAHGRVIDFNTNGT